ncbi:MAG: hypothetical protein Q4P65_02460 [Eubacteriales bacterium]|nr:hypothetical protein [Eubacteriales bacterium]
MKKSRILSMIIVALLFWGLTPVAAGGRVGEFGSVHSDLVEDFDFCQLLDEVVIELNAEQAHEFYDSYTYDAGDVHLPKILLDSADADEVNELIADVAEYLADYINGYDSNEPFNAYYAQYSVFQNEEILSLRLSLSSYFSGMELTNLCFTFELESGNLLSNEDIMEREGINGEFCDLLEAVILQMHAGELRSCQFRYDSFEAHDLFAYYAGGSIDYLWHKLFTEDLKSEEHDKYQEERGFFSFPLAYELALFYAPSGELLLSYPEYLYAQGSAVYMTARVCMEPQIRKLNPYFSLVSRLLDIDSDKLSDDKVKGLVWHLGTHSSDDDYRVYQLLRNLAGNMLDQPLPSLLVDYKYLPISGGSPEEKEFILIVPRQKNALLVRETFTGPDEAYSYPEEFGIGAALLIFDPEDFEGQRFCYRYRDEEVIFEDLLDEGKLNLPEGFVEGPDLSEIEPIDEFFFPLEEVLFDSLG